jgi:hypothetical protein
MFIKCSSEIWGWFVLKLIIEGQGEERRKGRRRRGEREEKEKLK